MRATQEKIEDYILIFLNELSTKYARLKLTEEEGNAVYEKEITDKFLPEMKSMGVVELPILVLHAVENIIYAEKI